MAILSTNKSFRKKFIGLALGLALFFTPKIADSQILDHCLYDNSNPDTLAVRNSGEIISATDWNKLGCILTELMSLVGTPNTPNFIGTSASANGQITGTFSNLNVQDNILTLAKLSKTGTATGGFCIKVHTSSSSSIFRLEACGGHTIKENNDADLPTRQFLHLKGSGVQCADNSDSQDHTDCTFTAGHVIYDEENTVANADNLRFLGNNIQCVTNVSNTDCTVSGLKVVKDETTARTNVEAIAFIGEPVTCVNGSGQTDCTIHAVSTVVDNDGTTFTNVDTLAILGDATNSPVTCQANGPNRVDCTVKGGHIINAPPSAGQAATDLTMRKKLLLRGSATSYCSDDSGTDTTTCYFIGGTGHDIYDDTGQATNTPEAARSKLWLSGSGATVACIDVNDGTIGLATKCTITASSSPGGTSYYQTVLNEGTPLTQQTSINFTGGAINCTNVGSVTTCTVGLPVSSENTTIMADTGKLNYNQDFELSTACSGSTVTTCNKTPSDTCVDLGLGTCSVVNISLGASTYRFGMEIDENDIPPDVARVDSNEVIQNTYTWTFASGSTLNIAGALLLPQTSPTTEGSVGWDASNDVLKIGANGATKSFYSGANSQDFIGFLDLHTTLLGSAVAYGYDGTTVASASTANFGTYGIIARSMTCTQLFVISDTTMPANVNAVIRFRTGNSGGQIPNDTNILTCTINTGTNTCPPNSGTLSVPAGHLIDWSISCSGGACNSTGIVGASGLSGTDFTVMAACTPN